MKIEDLDNNGLFKASVPVKMLVKHSFMKHAGILMVIAIIDGRLLMVNDRNELKFGDPSNYVVLDNNDFMQEFKQLKSIKQ